MWILLALTAAVGAAATSVVLKQAVEHGGVVVSTVAFRFIAGCLLALLVVFSDSLPTLTPAYWRATALVIPPEVGGMICLTLALRSGDLSLVQPILGLLPLFVMVAAYFLLNEVPTAFAGAGVVLVTAGVYTVGLNGSGSILEPFRALAQNRTSWFAVGAAVCWSLTTIIHKIGIAEVGPFPWAVTLTIGSSVALSLVLPILRRTTGSSGIPRSGTWLRLMLVCGLFFALQQVGLHLALQIAHAGYVVSVNSTSTIISIVLGVFLLGERSGSRNRIIGGVLVTAGAVVIALYG